ncbi:MAG: hypothetical protein ACR2GY_08155 [Phycisphaerales bacterium]
MGRLLTTTLRRAQRRMRLGKALHSCAIGISVAAIAAIVVILLERLQVLELPRILMIAAGLLALGGVVGGVFGWLSGPDIETAAALVDERLKLKDRLGTARALETGSARATELAPLVERDAEVAAAGIHVPHAVPVVLSRTWLPATILSACVVAAGVWLPDIALAKSAATSEMSEEDAAQLSKALEQAAAVLDGAINVLTADGNSAGDETTSAAANPADVLEQLRQELLREDATPESFTAARDEAARELIETADKLREQAEREERALAELAREFQSVQQAQQPPGSDTPRAHPDVDALRNALAEGDFQQAQQLADSLRERLATMPPDEQQRVADDLRRLAAEMDPAQISQENDVTHRDPQPQNAEEEVQRLRDALAEQGVDPHSIDELLRSAEERQQTQQQQDNDPGTDQSNPAASKESIEETLRQRGVDQETAQRLADEIMEQKRHEEAREDARQSRNEIADALRKEAAAVEEERNRQENKEQQQQPAGDEQQPQPSGDQQQQPSGDEQQQQPGGDEQQPQPGGEEQQPQPGGDEQQQQPGGDEQQQQPGGDEQQPQPGGEEQQQQPDGEQQQQPGGDEQQQQPGGDQQQPQPRGDEQQQQSGEEQQQQQPGGDEHQQQPANDGQRQQPSDGSQPGDTDPEHIDEQSSPGDSHPDQQQEQPLRRELERLQQRQQQAQQTREQSEAARDAAKRLSEELTAEERKQLEAWSHDRDREGDPNNNPNSDRNNDPRGMPGIDSQSSQPPSADATAGDDDAASQEIPVDLRDPDAPDRIASDWLSDDRTLPDDEPGRTTASGARDDAGALIERARTAAERAVNESTVPNRYHDFIRRYFKQLDRAVEPDKDDEGE